MAHSIRKAVFPVAGLGTRFLPATKVMPKEMLVVVDKPLIQYAVEEAAAAGVTDFIFVNSRGKSMIDDHFDEHPELITALEAKGKSEALAAVAAIVPDGARFATVRQPRPLGLGHAVWCAHALIGDEPFAVLLPDDLVQSKTPCLKQLAAAHDRTGGSVVAVMDVPREQTNRYGILDVAADEGGIGGLAEVRGLVEKPDPADAPSTLSIIGRYILMPEVFEHLAAKQTGAGGEIQLTDAMAKMLGKTPFHGLRFEGVRHDCGDKTGWLVANMALALDRKDLDPSLRDRMARLLAETA
jgi:UTP--glucose-1-phosphate uridylyltransferase